MSGTKFMVQSVNPIPPAEPRQPASANTPSRGSDPFSELLEAAVKEHTQPEDKRSETPKRSEPTAATSQARTRSESLARGDAPDSAPAQVRDESAAATSTEIGEPDLMGSDDAPIVSDTISAETPASDGDAAEAPVQQGATVPSAPAAAAPVDSDSGANAATSEANAATNTEAMPPADGIQTPDVPVDANTDSALPDAANTDAQSAAAKASPVAAPAEAPVAAGDGAAGTTDETAAPAPAQAAQSMKQAAASAQTQAAAETIAPQDDAATSPAPASAPRAKEQSPALQPQLSNPAAATSGTTYDTGADANLAQQQQSAPPTAQLKPDDAAARSAENAASPSVPSASDEPAARTQPNAPAPHSSEPARILASSFNPASVHSAHAAETAATPLTGRALAVEIVSQLRAGKQQFEIRLDPPELGRVDVRLEMDRAGNVTTKLTVDRPETLELMQREARGLERALQSAGLKTDAGGLEFSLRSHAQADFSGMQDGSGNSRPRADLIAVDESMPVDAAAESYRAAAIARGGIDIRV